MFERYFEKRKQRRILEQKNKEFIKRQYQRRVDELVRELGRESESSLKASSRHLRQFRRVLLDRFQQARTEPAQAHFQRMLEIADEEVRKIETLLKQSSSASIDTQAALGEKLASDPLLSLGLKPEARARATSLAGIDPQTVNAAKQFSADLIGIQSGGLSADLLRSINNEIRLGILGGKAPQDSIEAIARILKDDGPFFGRAERIFRTEGLRIESLVEQASAEVLDKVIPMVKIWNWSGVSRTGHREADGQKVPVDKKFKVRSELGEPFEFLEFPRDPRASARNTVNCGCFMTVEPDFDKIERFLEAA